MEQKRGKGQNFLDEYEEMKYLKKKSHGNSKMEQKVEEMVNLVEPGQSGQSGRLGRSDLDY